MSMEALRGKRRGPSMTDLNQFDALMVSEMEVKDMKLTGGVILSSRLCPHEVNGALWEDRQ